MSVHDIKPLASRAVRSTGSLTPSGSRSFAPVPVATPAPVLPRDDPDYVWDVFYHRAGLTNDYDAAANIGTLYVNSWHPSKGVRGDDFCPCRTGLPEPLTDPYASASDSEEEDEADEDSNGA